MKYAQIPPPAHLKAFVRGFWTLEAPSEGKAPTTFRTFADGSPGLIFHEVANGSFYQNGKELPHFFLYGQATTHANIHSTGPLTAVGIFLRPDALKAVFGLNASLLTDTCMDASMLILKSNTSLIDQLQHTASLPGKIELLAGWLHAQAQKHQHGKHDMMQYAVTAIAKSKGNIALKGLQTELQLSERSFERKFKEYIGISPKLFSRICRFQATLQQLRNNNYGKLSDIAFENDYADQSHFIRAFKEFAGVSPLQYQKASTEIIDNLATVQ